MGVFSRNFSTVVALILQRTDRWPTSKAKTAHTNGRWRTSDVPLFGVEMRNHEWEKKYPFWDDDRRTPVHTLPGHVDTNTDGEKGGNVGDTQFTLGLTDQSCPQFHGVWMCDRVGSG